MLVLFHLQTRPDRTGRPQVLHKGTKLRRKSEDPESRAPAPRISTGEPKRHYISEAVRHVQMRQGTIGIKAGSVVMSGQLAPCTSKTLKGVSIIDICPTHESRRLVTPETDSSALSAF